MGHTTGGLVDFHHDWVVSYFELFLLLLELFDFSLRVGGAEHKTLVGDGLNGVLLIFGESGSKVFVVDGVLHLDAEGFKSVLGLNLSLDSFVLFLEFISLGKHALDLSWGETTLIV